MDRPNTPPVHSNANPNMVLPYYRLPGECPSPLRYRYYDSENIDKRLAMAGNACQPVGDNTWALSFQPCVNDKEESQDRWAVQLWGDRWLFAGVFDGHAGVDTAEHAYRALPKLVKEALYTLLEAPGDPMPGSISNMLSEQIQAYDTDLAAALTKTFTLEKLQTLSDEDLDRLVNDHLHGGTGEIHTAVLRCMRGTTAAILLVDKMNGDLWTAGVGDSEAVLASTGADKPGWTKLTEYHNGTDPSEIEMIKAAHPGEENTCIYNGRVLGAIAVTRALGDHEFKMPAIYTEKIFLRARDPGFAVPAKVEQFMVHNHTPPYMSAVPDVRHHRIRPEDKYLLLCTDGLRDLWDFEMKPNAEKEWVETLCGSEGHENLALRVLRHGLGGADTERCSMLMGLQLEEKWMDDTTIIVVALD